MNVHQETMRHTITSHGTIADYLATAGFGLAMIATVTAVLSGLGTRWGWWYFMTGFGILRLAAIGGCVAAAASLLGGILARHEHHRAVVLFAAFGILFGLLAGGIPLSWLSAAGRMPLIHDISTDTENPPRFEALMPLRKDAPNSAEYGGPGIAAQQHAAYPDIAPLVLPISTETAYDRALRTAVSMGWQIVDSNVHELRIEAIATTFWFGFKDDIVIRVQPAPGGSRIDMRSLSRVGLSDIGTNANRIRTFLSSLKQSSIVDTSFTTLGY